MSLYLNLEDVAELQARGVNVSAKVRDYLAELKRQGGPMEDPEIRALRERVAAFERAQMQELGHKRDAERARALQERINTWRARYAKAQEYKKREPELGANDVENVIAQAAKDLGVTEDEARKALEAGQKGGRAKRGRGAR